MSESIDSIDPIKKIERGYSSRSYHIALNKAQQNLKAQLGSKRAIFLAEQQQEQQSKQRLAEQKLKEQQLLDLLDEQISQDSTAPNTDTTLIEQWEGNAIDKVWASEQYQTLLNHVLFGSPLSEDSKLTLQSFYSSTSNTIHYGLAISPQELLTLKKHSYALASCFLGKLNYAQLTSFANLSSRLMADPTSELKEQLLQAIESFKSQRTTYDSATTPATNLGLNLKA